MLYLNNRLVEITKFPNGESLINTKNLITQEKNVISLKFENDLDLMNLVYIKKHLNSLGQETDLLIPYMPYNRMDRTEDKTVFTLKYVCNLINNLQFKTVTIYEPHSDVCVALLDRVQVENVSAMITESLIEELYFNDNDYLFFPDGGAMKRYSKQIRWDRILTANKERDFETGYIKKLTIEGDIPKEPFRVIIVDDLCSKGTTFFMSSKKLKEIGATDIYLVVAHCENTIFDGDILKTDLISKVYTTDSILTKEHKKIEVVEIKEEN